MAQRRRSSEEWRGIIEAWLASGEDRKTFAARAGVNATTLGWWKWKLGIGRVAPLTFAEVEVVNVCPPPEFVVDIGALRVRVPHGFDAHELRRLVAALC